MLPFGLHVKIPKQVKKIPMQLITMSLEENSSIYNKMLNLEKKEVYTRKRRQKKNNTKKKRER